MANILDDKKKNEPVVGAVSPAPIASASTAPVAAPVAAPAQYTPTPIQRASVSMPADRAWRSPADRSMNQARDWAAQQSVGVNQQLQMHRNEMGTTDTSLTQMAAQLDPSIRQDAERARQWRMMTPQQRRDEVDRLAMEQDARTADQLFAGTWEDIQKYARSLADPTGMFIDSYGRENPMYSPGTAERIRGYQRKIESAIARMMSSYDRTKWDSPQAFLDAVSALPEVIEAGEFGKSIVFNIVRKYATPTMRAQMEAEDRNMKLFEQAGTKKALEEIVQKMAQDGRVNPKYANGYRLTNDGTKELLRQVWLNKDNDPRAGYIVNEIMANAPVMWMEEGGRVVQDPAHQERRRMMLKQLDQQAAIEAKKAKDQAKTQALAEEAAQREQISGVKHYVLGGKIVPETELKRLGQEPERQQLPRAAVDRAYSQARQDAQKYESALQLQQSDPQEYFANAVQSALSVLTPEERNAEIPRLLEIAKTRELTKEDFGEYGNFDAFKEMIDAYNDAISQNPTVLQAQIQRSKEEMERIERDEYGVVQ